MLMWPCSHNLNKFSHFRFYPSKHKKSVNFFLFFLSSEVKKCTKNSFVVNVNQKDPLMSRCWCMAMNPNQQGKKHNFSSLQRSSKPTWDSQKEIENVFSSPFCSRKKYISKKLHQKCRKKVKKKKKIEKTFGIKITMKEESTKNDLNFYSKWIQPRNCLSIKFYQHFGWFAFVFAMLLIGFVVNLWAN